MQLQANASGHFPTAGFILRLDIEIISDPLGESTPGTAVHIL